MISHYEAREQRRAQQLEDAKRLFHEDFPTTFLISHILFMVIFNILLIVIQVILLVNNAYLATVANGFWCAAVNLIAILSALFLCKLN